MKYYFSLIAFLMIAGATQAQNVNIGLKGGLNSYTIQGNNTSNFDPKYGFNVGLLGHIHLNAPFALQPEIVFSAQGANLNSGNDDKLDLNYVNIPLFLQYMFDNGFRIEVGPQLGILASAKSEIGNTSTDVKNNFENTDLGLVMGMSYVKPSTGFGYNIRFTHGFTNINATGGGDTYNRGFQLGLFYLFEHH